MRHHTASRARALTAAALAAAALAVTMSSPAVAAVGDFTVTGPASFPAPVAVGQTVTQAYTLTNHTSAAWEWAGIGFPPDGNGDLSWSFDPSISCPSSGASGVIAAGESCTLGLRFTPDAAGTHSLNFQLNFFPPGGGFGDQANIVTVTATAFDVALSLSPSAGPAFPGQPLAGVGPAQAVTVSALRPSTTVRAARVTGDGLNDFLVSNDGCTGTTLAATGDHCTVWLRFAPTALGARRATLEVSSGAETETVALAATGTAAAVGQQGPQGIPGPAGATGATGATGPAGKIVCRNTTLAKATCDILFAPGSWSTSTARFTVSRGHDVVVRGTQRLHGRVSRLVLRLQRRLRPGRYRITVTVGHGHRASSLTRTVTVS